MGFAALYPSYSEYSHSLGSLGASEPCSAGVPVLAQEHSERMSRQLERPNEAGDVVPDLIGAQVGLGEDPATEVHRGAQVLALAGEIAIAAAADEVRVVRELIEDRRLQFGKMPAQGLVDLRPGVGAIEGHAVEGEHRRAFVTKVLAEPMRHRPMQRIHNPNLILVVWKCVLRFVKHGEHINGV